MHLTHPENQAFFNRLLARLQLGRVADGPTWSAEPVVPRPSLGRPRREHPAGAYASAQRVLDSMPSKPAIIHRVGAPAYLPDADLIWLPNKDHFAALAAYYATLFRLLVLATARDGRLGRAEASDGRDGLVAHLGSVFLFGHVRLLSQTLEQAAGAIDTRLHALGKGRGPLFDAAAPAELAVDWILGRDERAKRTA
jgi:antirestriction protein ArdC